MITQAAMSNKISQQSRHEKTLRKSPKSPETLGSGAASAATDVTLMSNPEMSCRVAEKMAPTSCGSTHLADCNMLSRMELRARYKGEANTHRNMLSRQKTSGAVIHPEFRDFVGFLRHVGPMPAKQATLDRINNVDPEYGPGKVRWADKRTQNSNKSDTLVFHYSRTKDTYTASRLAKLQGVSPSTIRKRYERGWTDDEIIEGHRVQAVPATVSTVAPKSSTPTLQIFARTVPVAGTLTAREIHFQREASHCRYWRETYGEEPLMPSYEEMVASDEAFRDLLPERYERKFRQHWNSRRHHIIFENLSPSQQEYLAVIDPEYVATLRKSAADAADLVSKI
ncbi:hypothetical protein [Rhizobium sp. GN54]|uniref:hypothetical protein n=1 Tax=Rhizobium sp. GN54 TaxID=2898150 RepID=UPI001E3B1737|nr:hypothetical protein [Rhizobium sp. GN54]MCD2185234.1 hypothetical protein [Rhizobium sp. GN54]